MNTTNKLADMVRGQPDEVLANLALSTMGHELLADAFRRSLPNGNGAQVPTVATKPVRRAVATGKPAAAPAPNGGKPKAAAKVQAKAAPKPVAKAKANGGGNAAVDTDAVRAFVLESAGTSAVEVGAKFKIPVGKAGVILKALVDSKAIARAGMTRFTRYAATTAVAEAKSLADRGHKSQAN